MKSTLIIGAFALLLAWIFAPPEASARRICVIPIAPADYAVRHDHAYQTRARPRHRRCYYPRYTYGYYHSVPPYGHHVRLRRHRR
jgi:hypothetical protein